MARSVSTHRYAIAKHYNLEGDFDPDFGWSDFIDNLRHTLRQRYPSLSDCDRWQDREDHVILENGRCEISVSAYDGLVAVCMAPRDVDCPLDHAWCHQCAEGFNETLIQAFPKTSLIKEGVFSNGEAVFRLADQPGSCITSKEGRLW